MNYFALEWYYLQSSSIASTLYFLQTDAPHIAVTDFWFPWRLVGKAVTASHCRAFWCHSVQSLLHVTNSCLTAGTCPKQVSERHQASAVYVWSVTTGSDERLLTSQRWTKWDVPLRFRRYCSRDLCWKSLREVPVERNCHFMASSKASCTAVSQWEGCLCKMTVIVKFCPQNSPWIFQLYTFPRLHHAAFWCLLLRQDYFKICSRRIFWNFLLPFINIYFSPVWGNCGISAELGVKFCCRLKV